MKMDDDFIESNDLDWFASFSDGYLAHFTSGGTNLIPEKVKCCLESYEIVYNYFANLKGNYEFEIIEENLPHFDDSTKRNQYISSFIDAAAKGLFSYNRNFNDGRYFLIAKPLNPLLLNDLPENISNKLNELPKGMQSGKKYITEIE
ncbi:hypothetical protein KIMH_06210 [Bombiscardovia apis]|uniref:Uncharacterized protein n=1 Tax=Bombiscardovia apis TaxID=2932182 RepID=A0ABM8BC66_9BIFI|nr:hypothetical protein [Bombiscardovia apis]BDR54510.1 hypothetical protein KIMH_06210 [Bombiscardovia apis]